MVRYPLSSRIRTRTVLPRALLIYPCTIRLCEVARDLNSPETKNFRSISCAMAQEIERKFLVSGEFKSLATSHSRIVQGYISSARGRTVRVRIRDDKGYLTIKGASNASGTSRYEWEKELPLAEAEELMKLCEPGIIDKTRYLVRSGKHVFEVDEFYGENEGLVVAEVELESEEESFVKPDFIGKEVTGDVRYYNSQLMKKPYKTW